MCFGGLKVELIFVFEERDELLETLALITVKMNIGRRKIKSDSYGRVYEMNEYSFQLLFEYDLCSL